MRLGGLAAHRVAGRRVRVGLRVVALVAVGALPGLCRGCLLGRHWVMMVPVTGTPGQGLICEAGVSTELLRCTMGSMTTRGTSELGAQAAPEAFREPCRSLQCSPLAICSGLLEVTRRS
ncbi:MAG: hypothetical protein J3K34DRAFT_438000 [Monoraphidium minutum]|nr:MAG: hypothetical protein J3K34DRAFT_438000 [Monoraphidium minutum]